MLLLVCQTSDCKEGWSTNRAQSAFAVREKVLTIAQLCQSKAANCVKAVDASQQLIMMHLCPQLQDCPCTCSFWLMAYKQALRAVKGSGLDEAHYSCDASLHHNATAVAVVQRLLRIVLCCAHLPRLSMQHASSTNGDAREAKTDSLPPNRLNCTVILVAIDGSQKPAISCAAKMLSGFVLH